MDTHISAFKKSVFVLSKNPILFLLPSVGAMLSITIEIIFATELYYSNGNKIFFQIAYLLAYFSLHLRLFIFN